MISYKGVYPLCKNSTFTITFSGSTDASNESLISLYCLFSMCLFVIPSSSTRLKDPLLDVVGLGNTRTVRVLEPSITPESQFPPRTRMPPARTSVGHLYRGASKRLKNELDFKLDVINGH